MATVATPLRSKWAPRDWPHAIYAIANASHIVADGGMGYRSYQDNTHLHGALAMVLTPNGNLIVGNSDIVNPDTNQPSELVEFTVDGQFVANRPVDPAQGGSFGMAVKAIRHGVITFAAVDDNTSTLQIWEVQAGE